MPVNPLWRKAPFVLRRFPGVLASLVAAAALLALAAAASPLFVSASASAAVGDELDRLTPFGAGVYATMTGPVAPDDVEAAGNPTFAERTAALEDATADMPHLGGIVSTVVGPEIAAAGEGRDDLGVRLLARTDALDHVTTLDGGGEGVWIADTTAEELGLRPGDELRLGLGTTPRDATVRVAGVYRALFLEPHTPYWRSLEPDIYPQPPEFGTPPTFVMADEATITDLATELGVERVDYLWEFPLDTQALSLGEAERAAADLERLGAALGPEGGPLAELFACDHCFPQRRVEYTTGMPRAVRAAKESAGTVRGPVDLLANAGSLVALIVVGAVGAFSLARRRVENAVLVARGTGPASAGTRVALEGFLPVLAGTVLGVAVAYLIVAGVGPDGAIDRDGLVDGLRAAAIRVPAALLLLGLVGGIWFARLARSGDTHGRRLPAIAWELPVLAVAAFCLYQLVIGDAFSAAEEGGVAQPSPYLLLFPIFLLAGVAGLGARGLRRLVRRWRARSAGSSEAVFLATHRLGAARLLLVLLVTASALALGMFVYAETVVTSYRATVRAASFLGTGSDVRGLTSFDHDAPADLPVPVTKVTQLAGNGIVRLGSLPVDIVAIDADTLPQTVYWDASYASASIETIVGELAAGGDPLPVALLGGGGLEGEQPLTVGEGATLHARVVGEEGGYCCRVPAVALHAHGESLGSAEHEPAVERAGNRAQRLLEECELLRDRAVVGRHDDEPVAVGEVLEYDAARSSGLPSDHRQHEGMDLEPTGQRASGPAHDPDAEPREPSIELSMHEQRDTLEEGQLIGLRRGTHPRTASPAPPEAVLVLGGIPFSLPSWPIGGVLRNCRLSRSGSFGAQSCEPPEVGIEGDEDGVVLDRERSEVRVADEISRSAAFGQQTGQQVQVAWCRIDQPRRWLIGPAADDGRRSVHVERLGEHGGVRRQPHKSQQH